MEEVIAILCAIIGLPWLIMHYVTKWKQSPKITNEDERLLDEMYNLARRLEARVETVERIVAADSPDFRSRLTSGDDYHRELGASDGRPSLEKRSDYRPRLDEPDYRPAGRN